jgi:hypothetical protein
VTDTVSDRPETTDTDTVAHVFVLAASGNGCGPM